MDNNKLFEMAEEAINNLFSDLSVDVETTRSNLQALIDDLEMKIESLPEPKD